VGTLVDDGISTRTGTSGGRIPEVSAKVDSAVLAGVHVGVGAAICAGAVVFPSGGLAGDIGECRFNRVITSSRVGTEPGDVTSAGWARVKGAERLGGVALSGGDRARDLCLPGGGARVVRSTRAEVSARGWGRSVGGEFSGDL